MNKPKERRTNQGDAVRGLSLTELAKKSGVTERTIRFYITRGIIPGPARGGRAAMYSEEHLAGIQNVRRMQGMGLTLAEIEQKIQSSVGIPITVEPKSWWLYAIVPDVIVQVRTGLSPWRAKRVRSALAKFAAELANENDQHENGDKKS